MHAQLTHLFTALSPVPTGIGDDGTEPVPTTTTTTPTTPWQPAVEESLLSDLWLYGGAFLIGVTLAVVGVAAILRRRRRNRETQ